MGNIHIVVIVWELNLQLQLSKEYVVKSLWKHFLALWKEKMNNCSDGKLQTYTKVKTSFGCEKYLKLIRNSTPKALVNSAVQEKLKMK